MAWTEVFSSKKWTEEKKEGQGLALGGFKKEDSRRVFPTKNWPTWRVLTESRRGANGRRGFPMLEGNFFLNSWWDDAPAEPAAPIHK